MRLLTSNSRNEISLTEPLDGHEIPPYAILSHTWGAKNDEVNLADLQQGRARDKKGYEKIQFCFEQAQRDRIKYFWIDTCCIDKSDGAELSEAINSMYRWYRDATKCYVYLSDVLTHQNDDPGSTWEASLQTSRWFTRGWTLQELIAPKVVEFFSSDGVLLGTKETLAEQIRGITGLPLAALYGAPPAQYSIAERWRWARGRQTSKAEDRAYCLLGIFDVFMPLIYGEGDHAFLRLEEEVNKRSNVNSTHGSVSNNHTDESLGVPPSLAQTQHISADEGSTERLAKQPGSDQTKRNAFFGHLRAMRQGQIIDDNYDTDRYNSLYKSLVFDRINFRINNVRKALLSTCEWLTCHPHFQTWYRSASVGQHNGFLWIRGKPGCGKSTLMKAALEWVRKAEAQDRVRQTIIPYFFNARAEVSLEKSAVGLYRTIAYHVLSMYSSVRPLFMKNFAFKDPGSSGDGWTAEELQEFLYDCVESHKLFGLCLFIDALDEAEYESDVRQMISFLIQLSDRAIAAHGTCQLRVCLSSRHYPHISIGRGLSLVVEEQLEHARDIETYISKQLTCLDGPEREILEANILQKSSHVFLWTVLVVEMLNRLDDGGAPLSEMQARLEMVPPSLDELFRDILLQGTRGIETTVLLFQWLIFSMRPLSPTDLFVAIEYSRSPTDPAWVPPSEVLLPSPDRLDRYILNYSHGLVEVVKQPPVVQFIHETVSEFLIKDNGLVSIVPALAANLVGRSHETLRIACLRCIPTNTTPGEYPLYSGASYKSNIPRADIGLGGFPHQSFLDYAVFHLFEHAEYAQRHQISQQAFLETQLDRHGAWLGSHLLWWNALMPLGSANEKLPVDMTLLYFVFTQEYFGLVSILLSLSGTVKAPKYRGTMLQLASAAGHPQMVQMLLKAGPEISMQSRTYGRALYMAAQEGHSRIVQTLLDTGAEGYLAGPFEDAALQIASSRGHESVVRVLLEVGASSIINGRRGFFDSALYKAIDFGDDKTVQALIDAGADVNVKMLGMCEVALHTAVVYGRKKIAQLLINAGADVNAKAGHHGSMLSEAITFGHEEIIQMLIDAGAEVNMRGQSSYDTPLAAAYARGGKSIVQMLLAAGARLDGQAEEGTQHVNPRDD